MVRQGGRQCKLYIWGTRSRENFFCSTLNRDLEGPSADVGAVVVPLVAQLNLSQETVEHSMCEHMARAGNLSLLQMS